MVKKKTHHQNDIIMMYDQDIHKIYHGNLEEISVILQTVMK